MEGFIAISLMMLIAYIGSNGLIFKQKNSINPLVYFSGKIALAHVWAALIMQCLGLNMRYIPITPLIEKISLGILTFGLVFVMISYINMGKSLRVGLPEEKTKLKTKGLFSVSRNPIYFGFFIVSVGTVIYTLNPFVLISAIISGWIHFFIILAEETYLIEAFGETYKKYKSKVRRLI